MNEEPTQPETEGWHIAPWPALAWLETAIKLAAILIGIVALVQALSGGTFTLPGGIRSVAILDRIADREIVAMALSS